MYVFRHWYVTLNAISLAYLALSMGYGSLMGCLRSALYIEKLKGKPSECDWDWWANLRGFVGGFWRAVAPIGYCGAYEGFFFWKVAEDPEESQTKPEFGENVEASDGCYLDKILKAKIEDEGLGQNEELTMRS